MSESNEEEERDVGNGKKSQMTGEKSSGKSQTGIGERGDGGEGINSGCDQVPSGGRRSIGKRGSCCGNGMTGLVIARMGAWERNLRVASCPPRLESLKNAFFLRCNGGRGSRDIRGGCGVSGQGGGKRRRDVGGVSA